MDEKLKKRLDRLDNGWASTMKMVDGLELEQFSWQPGEGQWSIDQVFNHLFKAEQGSLAYLKKKTSGNNKIPKAGLLSEVRFQALKRALVSRRKWKAPKMVANIPPVEDHNALMRDWAQTRKECRAYIESLPLERRQAEVFKHPLAGKLSVYRMLDFFALHQRHHQYQLERILAQLKKQSHV